MSMLLARLRKLQTNLVLKAHGSGVRAVANWRGEMGDQPIPASWIEEGAPRARAFCSVRSADGQILSGEWDCTAGRFSWTYCEDEMVRILEGEARIEIEGVFRSFGPGDSVFFPLGQTVRWHVPNYVRKVFFIRHPNRIVDFIRAFKVPGCATVLLTSLFKSLTLTAPPSAPETTRPRSNADEPHIASERRALRDTATDTSETATDSTDKASSARLILRREEQGPPAGGPRSTVPPRDVQRDGTHRGVARERFAR
jgi:uncharacterized cupin superfamily protein